MAIKGITAVVLAVATMAVLDCCQRKDAGSGSSNSAAKKKAIEMPQSQRQQDRPGKEDNQGKLTAKEAEAIAIKEVVKRTKLEARQLEADSELKGNVWRVIVHKLPPTPGAHWFVYVRLDGTIKDFMGGK